MAILMFDQRRTGLDPVTAVEIIDTADPADLGMVDMPAHHAIQTALIALVRQRLLKLADEVNRFLHPMLEIA